MNFFKFDILKYLDLKLDIRNVFKILKIHNMFNIIVFYTLLISKNNLVKYV